MNWMRIGLDNNFLVSATGQRAIELRAPFRILLMCEGLVIMQSTPIMAFFEKFDARLSYVLW